MQEQFGDEVSTKLVRYHGIVSLKKTEAEEILATIFPDAPKVEIQKAVLLCVSYGLNPLMKHLFLIPFNKGKPNESWATVMGIKAKRLIASRRGAYSYIDNTPRVITEVEQKAIFGEVDEKKLWVITKVRDPQTGAEAVGYGWWPKDQEPYGTEKGNTKFNMATIRSEGQALDRLRPGEMPVGIEVMPEDIADAASKGEIIEGEIREVAEGASQDKSQQQHWCSIHNVPFIKKGKMKWWAHRIGKTAHWCSEGQVKKELDAELDSSVKSTEDVDAKTAREERIDMDWLRESLNKLQWADVVGWMKKKYVISQGNTVREVIAFMTDEQKEEFVREVNDRLQMM